MSVLFTPLTVGDITIATESVSPCRLGSTFNGISIGMSAITRNRADPTREPNHLMKKYYLQRALGGAGIIVTEATLISPQKPQYDRSPGIWNMKQVAGWRKITNVVHLAENKIYCQLWHAGRLSYPDTDDRHGAGPVYAPSAIPPRSVKGASYFPIALFETPTEIPDPSVIVAQYKDAAINAKLAGFDGVELHAAAGFLVHQFLDSNTNVRTDRWGGSSENRARFGLEVLKALVAVLGANVSMKISPAGGFNDMGMPLQETIETYSYFISEDDKLNVSYITLARYVLYYFDHVHPSAITSKLP
ncbi:hypothetical protein C8R44DRAFT_805844 [Mycena epipterygia]|nr:hypothetical protein C8R44DRAFT_805844 [Mycena epipterygia]